jgi:hypothetical protein
MYLVKKCHFGKRKNKKISNVQNVSPPTIFEGNPIIFTGILRNILGAAEHNSFFIFAPKIF